MTMARILKLLGMAVVLVCVLIFVWFASQGAYGMIVGIFVGGGALILGVLLIVAGLVLDRTRGARRAHPTIGPTAGDRR